MAQTQDHFDEWRGPLVNAETDHLTIYGLIDGVGLKTMNTLTDEERQSLRDAVQRLLADHSNEQAVRTTMETSLGYDPVVWQQLADMGVVGLLIDERYGGSGVGPRELEAVMEEVGAALLCSPLLGSGVLAGSLLQALGDDELNTRLLPAVATGSCIAAAVLTGERGCWTQAGVEVRAAEGDNGWQVTGRGSYVLHGHNAQILLVLANTDAGLAVFEVEAAAAGVNIELLPTFDHTLRLASVEFQQTPGRKVQVTGDVWSAVTQALSIALVALAGEQAGGAQRCLDFTVEYAKNRIQFGRAIGSFQAIKHMAADLLLETESAISAARDAASKLAQNPGGATEAVSLAAFACADAFVTTTATSVQMHGGIAFTWDHPAHLYLRRARSGAELFGRSDYHREQYLQALGA